MAFLIVVVDPFLASSHENLCFPGHSKAQGKVTVRTGIDAHLDDLRQQLAILPQHLDRVAADLRREAAFRPTQEYISASGARVERRSGISDLIALCLTHSMHVVYFPQIGYLICVPAGGVIDMLADSTLEHQFSSPDK